MATETPSTLNRMALWDEIELAIAPYKIERATIPFSDAELVAMAIVCTVRRYPYLASKAKIHNWIIDNFASWRFRVPHTLGRVRIQDALSSYEIPLCSGQPRMGAVNATSDGFTMPLREGRVFLSNVLEPPRYGAFRFLDLPAEIRVRIYEMLFSFPKIMVAKSLANKGDPMRLWVRRREHQPGYTPDYLGAYVNTRPLQRILAILSTNRQIYSEAVPVFYQINRFKMDTATQLSRWMKNLAPTRLRHVRHVSILYTQLANSSERWKASLTALLNVDQLKSLEIDVDDRYWLKESSNRLGQPRHWGKYLDPGDVPGMEELGKLARVAETCTINGDCPRIKGYLLNNRGQRDAMGRHRAHMQRVHVQTKPQNVLARRRAGRL